MKNKSIYKNVIYKVLLNVFNVIVPIIIGPYSYRVLGIDNMGTISSAETIYNYFLIFAAFGIYNYGLREMSRVRDNKEKLKSVFTSLFMIGLVSNFIVLIGFLFVIYSKFQGDPKYLILFLYSINIFSNMFFVEWANEALENYDFITIKTIAIKFIYLILLFTFVRSEGDYLHYVALMTFSTFLNYMISFIYIAKNIGFSFKEVHFKRHIKPLIFSLIMANVGLLYTQLDRLMLSNFVDDKVVANYVLPQSMITIINTIILSVVYVTMPRLSNILGSDDEEAYTNLLNRVTETLMAFLFPASIGMFMLSKEIVLIWGGEQYNGAINVLRVFTLYMITLGFESILSNQILYVKKQEKKIVIFILIGGLVNIILNSILVFAKSFTPVTAIATTTIANAILVLLAYYYAKRKLRIGINMFDFSKLKYLFVSLIFIPVTIIIKLLIKPMLIETALVVIINSILYVGILILIKDKVIFSVINKMKSKLKKN